MSIDTSAAVSSVTFTAFDFETTGLYPASDRIVEFGAVTFRNGEIIGRFERLANPGIPISPDAAAVSGISDADVADATPVAEVVPEFVEFLGDSVLMAHNAPFDLGFLRAAVQALGLGDITNAIIDTQLLAMKAFPRRKSYGLQNLAVELGLPPNRAHRALDDAIMCMKLFGTCVEELSFMGDLELGEVLTGGAARQG
ncbi:MAG: PolC-type DNA polymerase III [Spirochaetota bacterium]